MSGKPGAGGRHDAQHAMLVDALGLLGVAVFAAGTARAVYVAFLGEGLDRLASVGRVGALLLGAVLVVLWRVARR